MARKHSMEKKPSASVVSVVSQYSEYSKNYKKKQSGSQIKVDPEALDAISYFMEKSGDTESS